MKLGNKETLVLLIIIIILAFGLIISLLQIQLLNSENKRLSLILAEEKKLESILYNKTLEFDNELRLAKDEIQQLRDKKCPDLRTVQPTSKKAASVKVAVVNKAEDRKQSISSGGNKGYLFKK